MVENNFILLEISGEYGNLEEYKKSLCEASLLGIDRVLFACIWDNNTENGEVLLGKVQQICGVLNILPLGITVGYDRFMYDQAMIGELKKENNQIIPNFISMIPMDEYKNSRGITIDEEEVAKKLAKIMQKN